MERHNIKAGVTVHIHGIPVTLVHDTLIETADGNMELTGLRKFDHVDKDAHTQPLEPLLTR